MNCSHLLNELIIDVQDNIYQDNESKFEIN